LFIVYYKFERANLNFIKFPTPYIFHY
jgi:hypothetical protein